MPGIRLTRSLVAEVRSLTVRQTVALVTAAILTGGLLVSTALGWRAVAIALLGLLGALGVVGVVMVRRRMAQEVGAVRVHLARERRATCAQVATLEQRLQVMQRRVVAAVEDERLVGADRHAELLARLDRVEAALQALSTRRRTG